MLQLIPQRRSGRHLSLCGVRCNTGTDGIFFPTLFTAAFKSVWTVVALATALYLFLKVDSCSTLEAIPLLLSISMIGFIIIQLLGLVNNIIILIVSTSGSLSNFTPRKKIEIFVYIGWLVYLIEFGWDVYSTYSVFSPPVRDVELDNSNCTTFSIPLTIYRVVVLSHWGILIVLFAVFVFLFDPLNCCLLSTRFNDIEEALEELDKRKNGKRKFLSGVHRNPFSCAVLCVGRKSNSKDALGDLVHLFRVIFDGLDTEYTFLDLLAGFRLQLIYHKKLRKAGKDPIHLIRKKTIDILSKSDSYISPTGPVYLSQEELQQYSIKLKFYLKYAMAAYGWPIHVYLNPLCGPISLCRSARCNCCCARCMEQEFDGNTCFPSQAAIKAMTETEAEDIIDASFVNAVHIVPFYAVKVEKEGKKEVIIAIRGTLSLKDALTDASARMVEVPGGLMGVEPCYIHRGIYRAALGVYDHLIDCEKFVQIASKPEYKIVLTGHSLGAGVGAVLAVLFKERNPDWSQDLEAYIFATPPVFSYALAEKSQSFITGVIGGYDIIPRMTIRGLGHLALSVKDLIEHSENTKQFVLCCSLIRDAKMDPDSIQERQAEELLHLDVKRPGIVSVESEDTALIEEETRKKKKPGFRFGKHLLDQLTNLVVSERSHKKESESAGDDGIVQEALEFTPGKIIHLEVEEKNLLKRCGSCGLKEAGRVKASWKKREDFSGIDVHFSMLLDHGPTRTIDFVTTFCDQVDINS